MKIVRRIMNGISIVIIAFAVVVLLSVVFTKKGEAPNIFGYSVFRVLTGSMEPTISVDTLIVVKHTDAKNIQKEDVITFYSTDPSLNGSVNTHRVVDIENSGGQIVFETKGDANALADKYPVFEKALIGKVVFQSHALGLFVRLISNPIVFIPLIVCPFIIMIIDNVVKTIRLTKKLIREEEKEDAKRIAEALKKRRELLKDQRNFDLAILRGCQDLFESVDDHLDVKDEALEDLAFLKAKGVKMVVLSDQPKEQVMSLVDTYQLQKLVTEFVYPKEDMPDSSEAEIVLLLAAQAGLSDMSRVAVDASLSQIRKNCMIEKVEEEPLL